VTTSPDDPWPPGVPREPPPPPPPPVYQPRRAADPPVDRVEAEATALTARVADRMADVGRNSAVQAAGTFASRILGFVRTALLVWCCGGMYLSYDSFTVANTLPNQIFVLLGSGVLTAILIPQLTRAMHRDDGGQDYIDRLLTLALLGLVAVTAVCLAAVPALTHFLVNTHTIQQGHVSAASVAGYYRLTLLFCFWFMPQVLFYGVFAVLQNVLNARGRFKAVAWAPAWANLIQIASAVVFLAVWGSQSEPVLFSPGMIAVLGGGTTLGIAVQALCLIVPLRRDGFRFRMRFGWRGYGFGAVSRLVGWFLATNAVSQVVGIYVSKMMVAVRGDLMGVAGPGSQANAFLLFMLPHSLITVSIITSLYPLLAHAWQTDDRDRVRGLIRRFLTEPAVLVIPASAALIALGSPIIRTAFLSITRAEVGNVWLLLTVYAVGLVFFGVGNSAMRYYYALEQGRTYFWFNALVPALQLVACWLALYAVRPAWGVAVICGGSTLGWILQALLFMAVTRRQIGDYGLAGVLRLWARLAVASAIAGGAGYAVVAVMDPLNGSRWFAPAILAASGVMFGVVFWGAAAALRITEFTTLMRHLSARVLRRS